LKDDQARDSPSRCHGSPSPGPAPRHSAAPSPPDPCLSTEPQHCPVCHCDLVYPIDWRRISSATWNLVLRCPNCALQRAVSLGREEVQRFNVALYQADELLARQTDLLAQQRIQENVEAFAAALAGDFILPTDF
jgi:hypothetical protein